MPDDEPKYGGRLNDIDDEEWGLTMSAKTDHCDAAELTREEGEEFFDRRARRLLGISGEEFLRRWDDGSFEDSDDPNVTALAILIPFAR